MEYSTDPDIYNVSHYALALQMECLLRYRNRKTGNNVMDILRIDPTGLPLLGMRPSQDMFSYLLEDRLNRGHPIQRPTD